MFEIQTVFFCLFVFASCFGLKLICACLVSSRRPCHSSPVGFGSGQGLKLFFIFYFSCMLLSRRPYYSSIFGLPLYQGLKLFCLLKYRLSVGLEIMFLQNRLKFNKDMRLYLLSCSGLLGVGITVFVSAFLSPLPCLPCGKIYIAI